MFLSEEVAERVHARFYDITGRATRINNLFMSKMISNKYVLTLL